VFDRSGPFSHSLLPFVATTLVSHSNPVTCLLCGLDRPLTVRSRVERIESDMVLIRPDIEHSVEIGGRAKVLYLDGLDFPLDAKVAGHVPRSLASRAIDALEANDDAQWELRAQLSALDVTWHPAIKHVVEDIIADPMKRMSQAELATKLGLERTRALRAFRTATGMTFRGFKNWTGVQAAARRIAMGELVRTAAMDAGFADSAHLTRSFRKAFGTTPTDATADLRQ
jgi:AraC-like DNA-binding protein